MYEELVSVLQLCDKQATQALDETLFGIDASERLTEVASCDAGSTERSRATRALERNLVVLFRIQFHCQRALSGVTRPAEDSMPPPDDKAYLDRLVEEHLARKEQDEAP